jgi:hypothetical protein
MKMRADSCSAVWQGGRDERSRLAQLRLAAVAYRVMGNMAWCVDVGQWRHSRGLMSLVSVGLVAGDADQDDRVDIVELVCWGLCTTGLSTGRQGLPTSTRMAWPIWRTLARCG